jgi:hypothetical protein
MMISISGAISIPLPSLSSWQVNVNINMDVNISIKDNGNAEGKCKSQNQWQPAYYEIGWSACCERLISWQSVHQFSDDGQMKKFRRLCTVSRRGAAKNRARWRRRDPRLEFPSFEREFLISDRFYLGVKSLSVVAVCFSGELSDVRSGGASSLGFVERVLSEMCEMPVYRWRFGGIGVPEGLACVGRLRALFSEV